MLLQKDNGLVEEGGEWELDSSKEKEAMKNRGKKQREKIIQTKVRNRNQRGS